MFCFVIICLPFFFQVESKNTLTWKFQNLGNPIFGTQTFSQTTLVSGSPFLLPLNGEELPTGNSFSQTPVGTPKIFGVVVVVFFGLSFF